MSMLGNTVLYVLSADDAEKINRRRTTGGSIAERINKDSWPLGAQAHIGNDVKEGDALPMIVTQLWTNSMVNGQVMLDGNDTYWATSRYNSPELTPGCWSVLGTTK